MARPRTFDETTALDTLMHTFRAHGFRNLSIRDIEQATGLSSGSLYNAWGDKDGILRAALDRYLDGVVRARLALYAGPEADLDDLAGLYLSLFDMPQADGNGCLVTNSVVEFGRGPSPVAQQIDLGLSLVEDAVRAVLQRHLPADRVEPAVMRLILLYHGLLTLSRSRLPPDPLRQAIADEFARLKALTSPNPL